MNKIVLGAVTAVVVGVGAAAGWYFLGKEKGPGVMTTGTAPALDCSTIKADVDATFAALPPELKATYSGLECSAQKLLFAELRFGVLGAGGAEEGAVKLSAVVLDNPFAANAKKIFNAASYPAGQTPSAERLALAGHLTAAKVTIGPEAGGGVSFENLDIADLGARQFAKAPPATLAALGTLAPADLADLLQAFSFSSFGFKNVAGGPQGSEPVLHIASIVLSAFDGAKLGGLDVASVSAKPEAGAAGGVTIGSLSLKGIGVADLATLLSSAGGMASTEAENVKLLLAISADQATLKDFQASGFSGPDDQVKLATVDIQGLKSLAFQSVTVQGLEGFSSEADVAFKLGKFTVTGVDVGSMLQTVAAGGEPDYSKLRIDGYELSDLSIGPKGATPVTLASLVASSSGYVDGVATRGTAKLTGFTFPATVIPNEEDRKPLTELGYDALKLEISSDYTYDPKSKAIDLTDFTVKLLDGGTLKLTLNFGNFDLKALQAASASFEPPAAMLAATVVKATLSYTDDSLIQRVLKMAAKEQDTTPDALLAQGKEMLKMQAEAAPGPVTKAILEGLLAFLDKPKSLTITAAPSKPISFVELGGKMDNPESLAAALGVTAKAN